MEKKHSSHFLLQQNDVTKWTRSSFVGKHNDQKLLSWVKLIWNFLFNQYLI